MFAVPFDEIAPIVGRSPSAHDNSPAALAAGCRARRTVAVTERRNQRTVVDAFLAASRDGDFDALLAMLDRMSCCAPASPLCNQARLVRFVVRRRPWPSSSRGVPGPRNQQW